VGSSRACPPPPCFAGGIAGLALVCAALLAAGCEKSTRTKEEPRTTQPSAALTDPTAPRTITAPELVSLLRRAERRGVLINLWATWCGPCREELPMLTRVSKEYAGKGLLILPVSVDEMDKRAEIVPTLTRAGFGPPYLWYSGTLEELRGVTARSWPGNVPVSFLFDATGEMRHYFTAQVYEHELRPILDAFLMGKLEQSRSDFSVAPGRSL
jgi:thiol-disulfide isomerase/thioredoxin